MLWASATAEGFAAPIWMTYRQAQELGAQVRKGEKGSLVVYANSITRMDENPDGEERAREIHFMKGYTVFNVEKIGNLPSHYYAKAEPRFTDPVERIAHLEAFFAATGADIRHRGAQAFYAQGSDYIQMPPIEAFRDAQRNEILPAIDRNMRLLLSTAFQVNRHGFQREGITLTDVQVGADFRFPLVWKFKGDSPAHAALDLFKVQSRAGRFLASTIFRR